MLKLLCLTQKNRGELLLNDADIKHQGEASPEGATDQMQQQVLSWNDLLGRSGNAAKCFSAGSDSFFRGRVFSRVACPHRSW
jgi:hypothetical protein